MTTQTNKTTETVQTYSSRSTALRGARRKGLKDGEFEIVEGEGRWMIIAAGNALLRNAGIVDEKGEVLPLHATPVTPDVEDEEPEADEDESDEGEGEDEGEDEEELEASDDETPSVAEELGIEVEEAQVQEQIDEIARTALPVPANIVCPLCQAKDGQRWYTEGVTLKCAHCEKVYSLRTQREVRVGDRIPLTRRSTTEGPTKLVWEIAEMMLSRDPNTTRKMVIAECVRVGIAYYTARTQYQHWFVARRESDANAKAAQEKQAASK